MNINIQCDSVIEERVPDKSLTNKKEQKGIIVDISVPVDVIVGGKKGKKWKSTRT